METLRKLSLLLATLIAFSLGFLAGCASGPNPTGWQPKVFVPAADECAIERAQSDELYRCDSTEMKNFVCIPEGDLEILHRKCLSKKPWWQFWD